MIPAAILMMVYWHRSAIWLDQLGYKSVAIRWLGIVASACLIIYVIALGAADGEYRLARRIGIIFYFSLTYLAQLLMVSHLWDHSKHHSNAVVVMLFICISCLIIGLTSLATEMHTDWHDEVEDAYEWVLALLLHCYFLASFSAWRATGFKGRA